MVTMNSSSSSLSNGSDCNNSNRRHCGGSSSSSNFVTTKSCSWNRKKSVQQRLFPLLVLLLFIYVDNTIKSVSCFHSIRRVVVPNFVQQQQQSRIVHNNNIRRLMQSQQRPFSFKHIQPPRYATTTSTDSETELQTKTTTTTTTTTTTPKERQQFAQTVWETISAQESSSSSGSNNELFSSDRMINGDNDNDNNNDNLERSRIESIALQNNPKQVTIYNSNAFTEFQTTIRGTYYINGLASCKIGNRLMHPFETHGYMKSMTFYGNGGDDDDVSSTDDDDTDMNDDIMEMKGATSASDSSSNSSNKKSRTLQIRMEIVGTPLTQLERKFQIPFARGVMSTLGSPLKNAFSSTQRNTANLSATLWPPPLKFGKKNQQQQQQLRSPMLIAAGDNGMPYVLDPITLKTVGPLYKFLPGLKWNSQFLAHTRIDEINQHLIVCCTEFVLTTPFQPAVTKITFYEYDIHCNLVGTNQYMSDRFMVFHDWMITSNYYVIPKNPATFHWNVLPQLITGNALGTDIFEMDESTRGEFILLPRIHNKNKNKNKNNNNRKVLECQADKFFTIFHLGPCYEHDHIENNNNNNLNGMETTMTSSSTTANDDDDDDNDTMDHPEYMTIYGSVFDRYQFGGEMGYDGTNQRMDPIQWSSLDTIPAPRLEKFILNVRTNTMVHQERIPIVDSTTTRKSVNNNNNNNPGVSVGVVDIPVDMPVFRVDGQKCRYTYFLGASRPEGWFPFRSVVKTDLQTNESWNWDAGNDCVASEPMFIPRPTKSNSSSSSSVKEDDGYVISIIHNSTKKQCELMIWDSITFSDGPIASINIGELLPWCVHGSWVPDYVG